MAEEMKKYLHDLMNSTENVLGIVVTDRDGVPILRVAADDVPELAMRPNFISTFSMATDQAGKLGMGKNNKMVCIYGNYQVVHFNKLPMVVTVIATSTANTGLLMDMDKDISALVSQLMHVVDI
ncbi:ragulator complex protein LAMTOR3 [Procambarus clarkii]|uniref:ragulator complex protein LAMTOR3 n=1 Tax=Procambarus clarkii TaxID=6728 RepID=UPI001E67157D|nr:ragulator complex protein LAMTOR3-like [Procambarus clarkii]